MVPHQADRSTPLPPSIQNAVGSSPVEQLPGPFSELASLCPIGAYDSGLGGLSIVAEIRRLLPQEDIVFYGDNAYVPYGGRSDEWLRNRGVEVAGFIFDQGAKTLVVACNAASAAGLEHLRARYTAPIVGLVPAVKPAVAMTRTGTIGVLATPAALRGRLLADVIDRFATPAGVRVVPIAPVGMVEAVERGELDTPETEQAVAAAVEPMLEAGADCIVLGCTHYPFLNSVLRRIAGDGVRLIDSSGGVAMQTRRVLETRHLLRHDGHVGRLTVYTSGEPKVVAPLVFRLVGEEVPVLHESEAPPPLDPNSPLFPGREQ
jgi:glutamate racemase